MKLKRLLSFIVLLILILLAAIYVKNNFSDFSSLNLVNPWFIIILIALFLINYLVIGIITKTLMLPLKVRLGNGESFMLSTMTGFYNLITPFRGGMAARAVYLKKKHNFPYVDFLASLAASYVLIFLVAGILGLFSTWMIYLVDGVFSWIIAIIFLGITLSMLFIIFVSPKFKLTGRKWLDRFIRVINGWHLIKDNKKVIITVTGLSLAQLLSSALMLYLQFRVFGLNISFAKSLFLTSIGSLGLLIGITPAGLGINEAITVFSALTIGITPAESLSAAILGRAVGFTVLFILGPIFSYILLKKSPKEIIKQDVKENSQHVSA